MSKLKIKDWRISDQIFPSLSGSGISVISITTLWRPSPLMISSVSLIHYLNSNSPYCLPYNSYDANLENLVFDQLITPLIDIFLSSHYLSVGFCKDEMVTRESLRVFWIVPLGFEIQQFDWSQAISDTIRTKLKIQTV